MKKPFLFLFLSLTISNNSTSPIIPDCIKSLFSSPKITTNVLAKIFFNSDDYTGYKKCKLHEDCASKRYYNQNEDKFANEVMQLEDDLDSIYRKTSLQKANPTPGVQMHIKYDPDKKTYCLTTIVSSSFSNDNSTLKKNLLKGVKLMHKTTDWRRLDDNTDYKEEFRASEHRSLIYKTLLTKEEYETFRDE